MFNGSGNRGGGGANLCYFEHLGGGRDHLIETIDRVSCMSRSPTSYTQATLIEKKLTEFYLDVAYEQD